MFKRLGKDNCGTISLSDFIGVMSDLMVIPSEEISQMFKVMDTHKTGKSSYSEFVASLLQTRFNMHADLLRRPSPASTG